MNRKYLTSIILFIMTFLCELTLAVSFLLFRPMYGAFVGSYEPTKNAIIIASIIMFITPIIYYYTLIIITKSNILSKEIIIAIIIISSIFNIAFLEMTLSIMLLAILLVLKPFIIIKVGIDKPLLYGSMSIK